MGDDDVTPVGDWPLQRQRSMALAARLDDLAKRLRLNASRAGQRPARMHLDLVHARQAERLASELERHAGRSQSWDRLSPEAMGGERVVVGARWRALVREAEQVLRRWADDPPDS